jgi:hypothetical protein
VDSQGFFLGLVVYFHERVHTVSDISLRRSLQNVLADFSHQVAPRTRCFMSSGDTPELVFEQKNDNRTIIHESYYQRLLNESGL